MLVPLPDTLRTAYYQQVLELSTTIATFQRQLAQPSLTRAIASTGKALKPAKVLQYVGSFMVINAVGVRDLRALVDTASDRSWQRMKGELARLALPQNQKYRAILQVQKALEEFCPLKLKGYRLRDTTSTASQRGVYD